MKNKTTKTENKHYTDLKSLRQRQLGMQLLQQLCGQGGPLRPYVQTQLLHHWDVRQTTLKLGRIGRQLQCFLIVAALHARVHDLGEKWGTDQLCCKGRISKTTDEKTKPKKATRFKPFRLPFYRKP